MSVSRTQRRTGKLVALALACVIGPLRLDAVTLVELVNDAKLTPKRFAANFMCQFANLRRTHRFKRTLLAIRSTARHRLRNPLKVLL